MKYRKEAMDINKLAYPVLLNYILTSVFELLDEAVVGHYSVQGFALVGIAASVIYSVTGALGILSAAFHILAAEKKGKNDELGFEQIFISGRNVAVIIGVLFITISILFGRIFFRQIYGLEGEALKSLLSYFYPATISVLQNMLIFLYSAYFRNRLNTKLGVYVTFISITVNLFFDYSFVYGRFGFPKLGIAGAAWGSVIGLFCGLLVYQITYYKKKKWKFVIEQGRKKDIFVKQVKELFSLYPSLLGQELLESTVFVLIVTAVIARLGTEQMAVYKLLDLVCGTIGLPAYAYATASQTYAIQKYAANKNEAVKRYLKAGTYLGIGATGSLCVLCAIWRMNLLQWIVADADVTNLACRFLGLIFLIVIVKVPYQVYMSYLQGSGLEKYVFVSMAIGTMATGIAVIVTGHYLGIMGIYLMMLLEYTILGCVYIRKAMT